MKLTYAAFHQTIHKCNCPRPQLFGFSPQAGFNKSDTKNCIFQSQNQYESL
jgi:hypothetical protein